ncbi:ABC transporter ATP-binding protein [Tenacibaculum finnmarkense genomovar finnmarkense]|uniref:ATP-binding cassette domain-containing protein n=1 Tax=Tenacibaculum finnmarkense genomovar finnmarkense TaxID=1458503 RepID=A0AAP1RFR1_9FLAO|nr:ABC transporter ATP-binding protein [Tenacibaculum finnmarkense]MBE7652796.1 ATP-binding cassette domain-containing protein [Tenacibaculum finnmarkense genomovar finnmarkense]MBE7695158.1 ATP-binding cassette domain-containing protein [Tenacibaculum finnmarkense genomovar finnmarkense]MCD8411903.1 ABC transporter ATP-binding protein/permease [Tenacibaculum finnmarkense genomovar ulcerans]MCD8417910.1 ABC transporter ATP-binding protein/permease [Tenacibaculum finnmarkense genomovar finnmarke
MGYFKDILKYEKKYRKFTVLNIVFNILYAIFNVLSVLAFIPVLGILFGTDKKIINEPNYEGLSKIGDFLKDSFYHFISEKIKTEGDINTLVFICLLALSLFFLKNLFRYLASYVIAFLRTGIVKDLRDKLYDKIVELPISYFSEKRKGDIIARMTSDVQEVEGSIISSIETIVREPLTVIISISIMLFMSLKLTLFVFVLLPVSGIIISSISKKLKANSAKAQKETGNFLSFIEETLTGLRIIKGFNAESVIATKFNNSTSNFKQLTTSVFHRKSLASPMSEFLGSATIIAILWYGGTEVLSKTSALQPDEFFGYIVLFYTVLNPIKLITSTFYNIQKGEASAERIMTVLNTENTIKDKSNATIKETFKNKIEFKNISFKYKDDYVLKDFTLTINKGETVALVGQSGSGKSTLANLITRFYDVNKGEVVIDDDNIRDITKKSLRNLMGIVSQDSILFNDTITNNLKLGSQNANDTAVLEAAKIANADEFIQNLPEKYNTNIGDSGNTLSGGQKQRLSIARAVLKNPPIMILDEATSALDTESEQLVQVALDKMMKNRTSLVIAHRLSTIQNADKIVVMKKGAIVEQGKHDELLAKKGEYYKLVTMQSLT